MGCFARTVLTGTACLLVAGSTLVVAGSAPDEVITDHVDLVEVNFCYDDRGHPMIQQLIFYDWCPVSRCYRVRDFRLLETVEHLPHRVRGGRTYVVTWFDERDGVARRVIAKAVRTTYTRHDPEMVERDRFPKDMRRELTPALRRR